MDEINSDNINLVYGPIMEVQNYPDYVFVNETLMIPITFLAKPRPSDDEVSWNIGSGDNIQIMQLNEVILQ